MEQAVQQEPRPPKGQSTPPLLSTLFHQLSIRRQANRGDRTPLELFLAGLAGWDGAIRRRLDDGKGKSD